MAIFNSYVKLPEGNVDSCGLIHGLHDLTCHQGTIGSFQDFDIYTYTPCTSYPMNPMTPRWYIGFKEHPSSEVIISMLSPPQENIAPPCLDEFPMKSLIKAS